MRQFHWNKIKKEILRIIAEYFHRQVKNEQLTIKDSWEICWFKQRQMSGILHPRRIWLLTQSIQHQTMDFQIQKYLNGLGIGAEGYSCDTEWEHWLAKPSALLLPLSITLLFSAHFIFFRCIHFKFSSSQAKNSAIT